MTSISEKVEHVKAAKQDRRHRCHWPGCERQVPPAMWGCKHHWYALPKNIRMRIWRAYRINQEQDRKPSDEYIAAAKQAQDWIEKNHTRRMI